MVRSLEPRFVLNATAELNALGQLLVMGSVDGSGDTVQLQIDATGQLTLLDEMDQVIPIQNHPGNTQDPLDPSAVTAGEIVFQMGEGDDILDLDLSSSLSVTVDGGGGADQTNLQFSAGLQGPVFVDAISEQITLNSGGLASPIDGAAVCLVGDVFFGMEGERSLVDLGDGSLKIDGRLILAGDVAVIGSGATFDLSNAVTTASSTETTLSVDLQQLADSDFLFGGADASGGTLLQDVSIVSASTVSFGGTTATISGDLVVRNVLGETNFDADVNADSVIVVTEDDITVQSLSTADGQITLSTSAALFIDGDLDTSSQNSFGSINLRGEAVQLANSRLTTAGGLVSVAGPVQIDGDVLIDSGNAGMADSGGRVQFFDHVQGVDGIADTLRINASGSVFDGTVRLQGVVGAPANSPAATALNGLRIDAGQIEINSVGVLDGDLHLSAINVRMLGGDLTASNSGDIVVEGALLLPVGDTSISAAGRVHLSSLVKGQTGTRDLQVTAGTDALFDGAISGVRNLDVDAGQNAQFLGPVSLSGDFDVTADAIRIAADVETTAGIASGNVRLHGSTLISLENNALVISGTGTIAIDAGGGVLDAGGGTLRSDSIGDAITLQDASRLVLGNVIAERGSLTVGVDQNVVGLTDQADGTLLIIDRLKASTDAAIDLTNPGNEIAIIERITASGEVSVIDSLFDLEVVAVDSLGSDVTITTQGDLVLAESAVMALGAVTTLTSGRAILDRDDTTAPNVTTGVLQLGAGAEGIGQQGNSLDVVATISVSADTAAGAGDIWLANVSGALPIGIVDAGLGDADLLARSINDAFDDGQINLVARRLTMTADSGIGSERALELLSVNELTAITDTGGIELELTATTETIVRRLFVDSGDILIRHRGFEGDLPVELQSVVTNDGAIAIGAGGTINALEVMSKNVNGNDDPGSASRDISLTATGIQSDIIVTTIEALETADVELFADDDVLDSNFLDDRLIIADDLKVTAQNLFADLVAQNPTVNVEDAIKLSTNVNDFQGEVLIQDPAVDPNLANRGDLRIEEVDSVNLANSDAQHNEIVMTSNGQIVIVAGANITVFDHSEGDDGGDLTGDPEIVALGENGRIELLASGEITLRDDVQLNSQQVTELTHLDRSNPEPAETRELPPLLSLDELRMSKDVRSVYLEADSFVFGERIEINTGEKQGVARIFAPRPIVSDDPDMANISPAFFVPDSVGTNILEQALVNDSTGILTIDIGQTGERGLTVDIDWGAETRQYQQLNGLSADKAITVSVDGGGEPLAPVVSSTGPPLLVVEHFYTEGDVLDSRENMRTSATEPFEVRFSVRHHESILVIGNTVSQPLEAETIPVIGQVISSTDNPDTPAEDPSGLENGVARFIIPNLSIPVAFFPVREVIPEFEPAEFIVRAESIISTTQATFETTETSTSSIVSREEYFQIRMRSPDPDGDDLAPPEKLPDDILDGDKLKELFRELKDGRYEIEYVLGDGNARSILQADVRGGNATIIGDELDEGELKLRILDSTREEEADLESGQLDPDQKDPQQPDAAGVILDPMHLPVSTLAAPLTESETSPGAMLPPVGVGIALTSILRRRWLRNVDNRLSVSNRFAARLKQEQANHS